MFSFIELTEIMRQSGDLQFIQLLNKIHVGNVDQVVENKLKSRFIEKTNKEFPHDKYKNLLTTNLSTVVTNSSLSVSVVTLLKFIQLMQFLLTAILMNL